MILPLFFVEGEKAWRPGGRSNFDEPATDFLGEEEEGIGGRTGNLLKKKEARSSRKQKTVERVFLALPFCSFFMALFILSLRI